ncbi:hypothetical protein L208DRAFT_1379505 [Tricholoma matsutake]|nr:hypothetical protein L208DRAFT_1379505 [Tricholoma matsutake 945]
MESLHAKMRTLISILKNLLCSTEMRTPILKLATTKTQEAANNLKAKQAKQAARACHQQKEPDVDDDVIDDHDGDPISDRSNNFTLCTAQAKTNTIKENALIRRDNHVMVTWMWNLQ